MNYPRFASRFVIGIREQIIYHIRRFPVKICNGSRILGLPKVHSPRVSISIATINKRITPAIMKLEMVTPNMLRIVVPAIANTSSRIPVVITALEETTLRSWLGTFLVSETYKGITPIGSITTNKTMVDVRRSCKFMLFIKSRDLETTTNEIDEGKERE